MTGMLFVMQQPGTSTMPKTSGSGCAQGKLFSGFLNTVNQRNTKYYKKKFCIVRKYFLFSIGIIVIWFKPFV